MLRVNSEKEAFVPLLNVSIDAWIDTFAADVTLMQTFVNLEDNPIEVVYVFPIEVLSWTLNAYSQMFIDDIINLEKKLFVDTHYALKIIFIMTKQYWHKCHANPANRIWS